MAVVVRIPTPLRKHTDGQAAVEADGATLREVFDNIESQHPGISAKVIDDSSGEFRMFVNVFVNGEDVRHGDGIGTAVNPGDEVSVVPAIAGGTRA